MFSDCYKGLRLDRAKLYNNHDPLVSFSGDIVQPLGSDRLTVAVGTTPCRSSITARFLIVDCPSSYNLILGRDILWGLQCFVAGHMLLMKVPTPGGILTVQGDRAAIEHCHLNSIQQGRNAYEMLPLSPSEPIDDPRDDPEGNGKKRAPRLNPAEDTEWISLSPTAPERKVRIGSSLSPELRHKLITFLQEKQAVFAWSYADMPGISPDIITHKLNILQDHPPYQAKETCLPPRQVSSYPSRGSTDQGNQIHPGSFLPDMGLQRRHGPQT